MLGKDDIRYYLVAPYGHYAVAILELSIYAVNSVVFILRINELPEIS